MEFGFTEEQALFAAELARYAEKRLAPDYRRWDRGEVIPRERIRELANLGVTGLRVPEEYGGHLASYVTLGLASEELARGDFNYSLFVQLSAIAGDLLSLHGSPAVKERWLPALASGEAVIAFAITEPSVGSDAGRLVCRATRQGSGWALTGEKASITFAGYADSAIVFARTGGVGPRGVSAFLVPLDGPGVSRQVYQSAGSGSPSGVRCSSMRSRWATTTYSATREADSSRPCSPSTTTGPSLPWPSSAPPGSRWRRRSPTPRSARPSGAHWPPTKASPSRWPIT